MQLLRVVNVNGRVLKGHGNFNMQHLLNNVTIQHVYAPYTVITFTSHRGDETLLSIHYTVHSY